ncbi:hypothetical protein PNK_1920 [Candidatus Protochlamydia naegleriophila]|uniref:CBM20 domain-containing protein n=1 Tax=Candidatus Protochlamydia naegleriophila TaxID=389348 RepID=A0A0U5JHR6_9BACT|nr:CBM20 domain-containing protein [Candidatus Protochlamydia naegleriophila]CUI17525.1 hypothetical protein PNK_1920 [Candidatus Protochlamydia naegleriophila]
MLTKKDSPKNTPKMTKISKTTAQASQSDSYALAKAPTQQPAKVSHSKSPHACNDHCSHTLQRKPHSKTRIIIKYDVGFNNQLYIRGKGAHLSWEKGQPLKNVKADEWVWETEAQFSQCEFKVLINDADYESGENHLINCGSSVIYTPHFH